MNDVNPQSINSQLEKAFEIGADEIKPIFKFDNFLSGYKDKEWYQNLLSK